MAIFLEKKKKEKEKKGNLLNCAVQFFTVKERVKIANFCPAAPTNFFLFPLFFKNNATCQKK